MKPHILATARSVLQTEIEGLIQLEASLGEAFCDVTMRILASSGRVVVTGMGKSGHIARKIAATFTSTGTSSLFLHPAEASHGDLGILRPEDMVIALSTSGETKELADVIAYCHRHTIPLIAVTQRAESTLARQATVVLLLPPVREACPNKLAPTTSSTMMLALGDAIAMTVLEQRGFSAKDFHAFHPGGQLGNQLKRVSDLMSSPAHTPLAPLNLPLREAIMIITEKRLGCVGIVNEKGTLVGIITDGDLRRVLQKDPDMRALTAGRVMTHHPKTIGPDLLAADAVRLMKDAKITSLFVVDEAQKPLGVLHIHDCLKAGII